LLPTEVGTTRAAYLSAIAQSAKAGKQGVHGISTRKVYPSRQLPAGIVRSYRTFSPLPAFAKATAGKPTNDLATTGSYSLRHFLCPPTKVKELHQLGGAVLCVVRTFLPERRQSGLRFSCKEKGSEWLFSIQNPGFQFIG